MSLTWPMLDVSSYYYWNYWSFAWPRLLMESSPMQDQPCHSHQEHEFLLQHLVETPAKRRVVVVVVIDSRLRIRWNLDAIAADGRATAGLSRAL